MQALSSLGYNVFKAPDGNPISNGKLYLYLENTNTPAVAFHDRMGSNVIRTWPIDLDNIGTAGLWLESDKAYRIQVRNPLGTLVLYENASFRVGESSLIGSLKEDNSKIFGKTMVYTSGVLTSIVCYADKNKTKLVKTIYLKYIGTVLSTVEVHDAEDNVVSVRTIARDADGILTGVNVINS